MRASANRSLPRQKGKFPSRLNSGACMGGTRTSPSHPGGNSLPSQNVAAELLIVSPIGVGSQTVTINAAKLEDEKRVAVELLTHQVIDRCNMLARIRPVWA